MKRVLMKFCLLVCVAALCVAACVGCASKASTPTEEQQGNRAYMSQVNSLMEQLGTELEPFVDAVSRNDLVNMRTQADNAYEVLNSLAALEAPDGLVNVKQDYLEGCAKLREALDAYITLFTETSAGSLDQSTYEQRRAQVQELYTQGVEQLKKADEAAAAK